MVCIKSDATANSSASQCTDMIYQSISIAQPQKNVQLCLVLAILHKHNLEKGEYTDNNILQDIKCRKNFD